MVFDISRDEKLRSRPLRGFKQRRARTRALGHAADSFGSFAADGERGEGRMPAKGGEYLRKGLRLREVACQPVAEVRKSTAFSHGLQNRNLVQAQFSAWPASRALRIDIQRRMGRVEGHIGLKKETQCLVIRIKPVGECWLQAERMVAQDALGALVERGTNTVGSRVKAYGQRTDAGAHRRHLQAAQIPRRCGLQGGNAFYGVDDPG